MTRNRLEAFSDGVIAILITIMVLELHAPSSSSLSALKPLIASFLSYALSFIYLGIYWNNHHHMLHTIDRVNGAILWANLHLLFWLSLVPFGTAWVDENHTFIWPTVVYGIILLMCAISYYILQSVLVASHGKDSILARALGRDLKGKLSLGLYLSAIGLAFLNPPLSNAIYALVALIWVIPDRRIEKALQAERKNGARK